MLDYPRGRIASILITKNEEDSKYRVGGWERTEELSLGFAAAIVFCGAVFWVAIVFRGGIVFCGADGG